jgi:hypothetical protein
MTRPVLHTDGRADASDGRAMKEAPIRALAATPTPAARLRMEVITDSLEI